MAEAPLSSHSLAPQNLGEIVEALTSISSKWYQFGIQVGVSSSSLDEIKDEFPNLKRCLLEMLKQRLKSIDPELTWEIIVAALRTKSVGEDRLAAEIEQKYCSTKPVTGEVPAFLNPLKSKLKTQLDFLQSFPSNQDQVEESKVTLMKGAVKEFVTTSLQSGASGKAVRKELGDLYANDVLISREIYEWGNELVNSLSKPINEPKQEDDVKQKCVKDPLFCKDTVYHASLCCYAVNTCTAADYNKFFVENFPHHLLEEVSFSRSRDHKDVDRYLIARQGKTYYVALQSEPLLSNWGKEFTSFEEGIQIQCNRIPLRYFMQQLHDGYKVVFTGFSFGGLPAQSLTASMWQNPLLSDDLLEDNVLCITFGQPLIQLPIVLESIKASPGFEMTLHSVFIKEDQVPRTMQFFDPHYEKVCADMLSETDIITPTKFSNIFKNSLGAQLLHHLTILQDPHNSEGDESVQSALAALKAILKLVVPHILAQSNCKLLGNIYMVQKELPHGLVWKQLHDGLEVQADLGIPKLPVIESLSHSLFNQHHMDGYHYKVVKSFVMKPPPPTTICAASCPEIPLVKPLPCSVAFHRHGKEIAVTVTGDNLWFCHQLQVGTLKEDISAQAASRKAIQFYSSLEDDLKLSSSSGEIKVSLKSHFCKPIRETVKVTHKVYRFSFRQEQLAKLTPSELIEVAYLSALLEQHPHNQLQSLSHRFDKLREFLVKIVSIVPIESLLHVIAQGDLRASYLCCIALMASKIQPPQSLMASRALIIGLVHYSNVTHTPIEAKTKSTNTHVQIRKNFRAVASSLAGKPEKSLFKSDFKQRTKISKIPSQKQILEKEAFSAQKSVGFISALPLRSCQAGDPMDVCCWFLAQAVQNLQHSNEAICGLNLETLYSLVTSREEDGGLKSPIDILHEGRKKLLWLSQQQFQSGGASLSTEPEKKKQLSELYNSKMLEVVNSIRSNELRVCTALLGAFMEEQFRVPLMKSSIDTAKLLDVAVSAVAMGVWAIFSLTLGDMQAVLNSIPSGRMLVDVTKYVRGIFKNETISADEQYAGKLQFMVQGLEQTVSCNTHYVSYSLERQLIELCKTLNIDESIPLEKLIADWDKIFKDDVLSLVAKTHVPLIARWLKWALMVHHLREELAKYTTIGVIGLVNSGKSLLVSTLFDINVPVGTTAMKRTTIPFLYNLDNLIDGLDVIDFPGVDDNDKTIPDLADLLLALAQVIVFVVDYRKAHTESAKKWLEILQEKSVPVLVCLTFADKLYAEHMSEEGQHPDSREAKQELAKEHAMIVEKLGSFPSNEVKFFSFCQDRDSVLNSTEGRQRLKEAGIESTEYVSEWLAGILESQLDQEDLAEQLRSFARKRLAPKQ